MTDGPRDHDDPKSQALGGKRLGSAIVTLNYGRRYIVSLR